jgi:DNA-binding transcriptional LysR family regulator
MHWKNAELKLMVLMKTIRKTLMRQLSLEQLMAFANIVDLGSFSAAAEKANLTQPAISLQLKQLERQLGVRLIERVGRRAQPTAAGQDLLVYVRRIGKEVSDAVDAMAPHKSGSLGRIRIGTGATACTYLLPRVIAQVKKKMPGLEITVRTGDAAHILRDLEANTLDLAIVTLPAAGRSFEIEEIYEEEMLAVAASSQPVPAGTIDPVFLSQSTLLLYEGGNTRRAIDEWFAKAGLKPEPTMEFGNVEAIKQLAGAGLGWAILPELALRDAGKDALTIRPLSPKLMRCLGMVVRRDKHLNRGLREMMQALRSCARS